jgi:hypothetical protein
MITSYLNIALSKSVFENYVSHLFDLIRLSVCARGLQIQDFLHSTLCEDVMIPTNSLGKAEFPEKSTHRGKRDVGVRRTAQDSFKKAAALTHRSLQAGLSDCANVGDLVLGFQRTI